MNFAKSVLIVACVVCALRPVGAESPELATRLSWRLIAEAERPRVVRDSAPIDASLRGVSRLAAIRAVARLSGMQLVMSFGQLGLEEMINIEIVDQAPEDALEALLAGSNLVAMLDTGSIVRIDSKGSDEWRYLVAHDAPPAFSPRRATDYLLAPFDYEGAIGGGLDFKETTVNEAIQKLSRTGGVEIRYSDESQDARVTLKCEANASWISVARSIADQLGCGLVEVAPDVVAMEFLPSISLQVHEVQASAALLAISKFGGHEIALPDVLSDANRPITLNLQNVMWIHAFESVCKSVNLVALTDADGNLSVVESASRDWRQYLAQIRDPLSNLIARPGPESERFAHLLRDLEGAFAERRMSAVLRALAAWEMARGNRIVDPKLEPDLCEMKDSFDLINSLVDPELESIQIWVTNRFDALTRLYEQAGREGAAALYGDVSRERSEILLWLNRHQDNLSLELQEITKSLDDLGKRADFRDKLHSRELQVLGVILPADPTRGNEARVIVSSSGVQVELDLLHRPSSNVRRALHVVEITPAGALFNVAGERIFVPLSPAAKK